MAEIESEAAQEVHWRDCLPLSNMVGLPGDVVSFSLEHRGLIETVVRSHKDEEEILCVASKVGPGRKPSSFGSIAIVEEVNSVDKRERPFRFRIRFMRRAEIIEVNKDGSQCLVKEMERSFKIPEHERKAYEQELSDLLSRLKRYYQALSTEVHLSTQSELDSFITRCAKHLNFSQDQRYELLRGWSIKHRLRKIADILAEQLKVSEYRQELQGRTERRVKQLEHRAFLQEEHRLIESELGIGVSAGADAPEHAEMRKRIEAFAGSPEARAVLDKEFSKLIRMGVQSPHAAVVHDYLEVILDLPWAKATEPQRDWKKVEASLQASHDGLVQIKRRVLEYIATLHLSGKTRGPILCFVGPPGVGKTSVARAVAEALTVPFVMKSLGGVHDEAEIRGHRRTYIGAMPGRILQGLKKSQCMNPVFCLDEVDKLGKDQRGNPADALLEVLDPEENHHFSDHYLEIEFDLSKVFWILTANNEEDIPPALRDRLEIIHFSSYTEDEKLSIGQNFLLRKNIERMGLENSRLKLSDKLGRRLIREYTREAGVRELDRRLSALLRTLALDNVRENTSRWLLSPALLSKSLGPPPVRNDRWNKKSWQPGVMAGLAWTPVGGSVLRMECWTLENQGDKDQLVLTGKLGEVMRESAAIAKSFLKKRAKDYELSVSILESLHVHIPAGAVPKEGPSAGLGLALLMLSACLNRSAKPFWAVTGEITLHGRVMPVGGVKEKVLAAQREGFKGVVLPEANAADLEALDERERGNLTFVLVKDFKGAYDHFFGASPVVVARKR